MSFDFKKLLDIKPGQSPAGEVLFCGDTHVVASADHHEIGGGEPVTDAEGLRRKWREFTHPEGENKLADDNSPDLQK